MTYEGLGEMFEGDSADMCAGIFLYALLILDKVKYFFVGL